METFESTLGELQGTRDYMQKQIAHHKARQEAIKKSILDFETKMNKLLVWHKEQETELSVRLGFPAGGCGGSDSSSRSSSSGGSGRLRRGRSKLSERLYAAIDNSN
jgi:chromosome segregation ATPase